MPYIGKTTDGFGIRERFTYLASAGATSISGADANGKTLLYEDPEYVDVFLNGIRLKKGTDYNTSTANTIAGLAALALNDEVEVIVQDVFTLADMVSANTGGDFRGNIAIQKDSGVLSFGADKEITVTHSADTGLVFKNTNTGDDNPFTLTLQTGDTDIAANDKLGVINFQAPDEGTGTDAILVAAGIEAVSEGDFAAGVNTTKLSFKTAASAAAAETMSLSSAGNLTVSGTFTGGGLMTTGGNIVIPDDGTLGSASDTNAIAISSAGVITISTNTDSTSSTSGALIAHSAGFADDVFIGDDLEVGGGVIALKNTGSQSQLRLYCESSNAHYAALQAPAHSDFSGNTVLTLPATTDTIVGIASTQTLTNKTLTSPKINEDVALTSTATELNLLDGVSGLVQADFTKLAAIDATATELNFLDGDSTIGTTAIADGDGIIHNDGGTMKVTSAATFKTYFQAGLSSAADDISAGDAAVNITTSSGNITIDAAANDSDIIFKGTDGSSDITMLTLDGSEAGAATFNGAITGGGLLTTGGNIVIPDAGNIGSASDTDAIAIASNGVVTFSQAVSGTSADFDGGVTIDNITIDGTEIDLSSGDLTIDVASKIILDADSSGSVEFHDGGTKYGTLSTASNHMYITSSISDGDIVFQGNDGGSGVTALTLDMSAAGDATFNNNLTAENIFVAGNVTHAGDNDTFIEFGTDTMGFSQGNVERFEMNKSAGVVRVKPGGSNLIYFDGNGQSINSETRRGRLDIESNIAAYAIASWKNQVNNTGSFFLSCLNHAGNGIGGISQASETTIAFNTSSDYRLKENVEYDWDATTRLKQLKPARFNWISDDTNTAQDGFLAHEVSDVVPTAINGVKDGIRDIGTIKDADGNVLQENTIEERKEDGQTWTKTGTEVVYQSIDHSKLVPLLVKTIQELEARIKTLEDA